MLFLFLLLLLVGLDLSSKFSQSFCMVRAFMEVFVLSYQLSKNRNYLQYWCCKYLVSKPSSRIPFNQSGLCCCCGWFVWICHQRLVSLVWNITFYSWFVHLWRSSFCLIKYQRTDTFYSIGAASIWHPNQVQE